MLTLHFEEDSFEQYRSWRNVSAKKMCLGPHFSKKFCPTRQEILSISGPPGPGSCEPDHFPRWWYLSIGDYERPLGKGLMNLYSIHDLFC